jgi:hypothetical protein
MSNPIEIVGGSASWTHEKGDEYLVTGVDRSGKRFRRACASWALARGINLWRGTKWLVRNGKRYKISTTTN